MVSQKRTLSGISGRIARRGTVVLRKLAAARGLVVLVLCLLGAAPKSALAAYVPDWNTFCPAAAPEGENWGVDTPFIQYDPDAPGAAEHGPYRMWFRERDARSEPSSEWTTHAWSWDGCTFTNRQMVHTADPRGDVITGYHQTGYPLVTKAEGEYRLYHWRYHFGGPYPCSEWAGCLEISLNSQDGVSFADHVEHAMDPLYMNGGWDNWAVFPGTIRKMDCGSYELYYGTGPDSGRFSGNRYACRATIGRAVSEDGITWPHEEIPSNDPCEVSRQVVLDCGGGEWDWSVKHPSVFPLSGEEGYGMFFRSSSAEAVTSIGFASSPDGIHWGERTLLFSEDDPDLAQAVGCAVWRVAAPRYFNDPESGEEWLYFTYSCEGVGPVIGRLQLVPEPGTLVLLGLGALCFGAYAWRRRGWRKQVNR